MIIVHVQNHIKFESLSFVLFTDTWLSVRTFHVVYGFNYSILCLQMTKSDIRRQENELSAWWLQMGILLFLRGLCGCA